MKVNICYKMDNKTVTQTPLWLCDGCHQEYDALNSVVALGGKNTHLCTTCLDRINGVLGRISHNFQITENMELKLNQLSG